MQVAGNIGPVALDALRTRLAAHDLPEVWVLELSSFQLATTRSLTCDAAAVLNITDDHLDWHDTLQSYATAKARIFTSKTIRILNRDDARVAVMARKDGSAVTFGADAPTFGKLLWNRRRSWRGLACMGGRSECPCTAQES